MKQQLKLSIIGLTLLLTTVTGSSCSKKDKEDCFTCNTEGASVNFCYTEGNDFYTMSVAGDTDQIELNGRTWASVKADKQAVCNQ